MSKFKAGDKVVALKRFNNIKIGDILTVEDSGEYWFQAAEYLGYSLYVANYELYKPQFRNMKFKVESPEHSKEIQEALFEMGFCWRIGCKVMFTYSFPPSDYLYTDTAGYLWRIDSEEDYLASSFLSAQEHTIETTKSYKLIPVEPPKETVTIDGKTYDKEAVLKRLAELEAV